MVRSAVQENALLAWFQRLRQAVSEWVGDCRILVPWQRALVSISLGMMLILSASYPAHATIDDNRYEGNIFALYGADGALIPPRTTLDQSLLQGVPTLLVYYLDDSKDCKSYAAAISNLHIRYGLGVNFIALSLDSLDLADERGPGRYFSGRLPQTVLFGPDARVTYESVGDRPMTEVENAIRSVFDLEPVDPGDFPRQPFNELQAGFGQS